MLGMKAYGKGYVADVKARVAADAKAGKGLTGAAEHALFNNMLLGLEYSFVHRLTGAEGKDGNPLNEVRVLCDSLLFNKGKLQVGKLPGWPMSAGSGIKLDPATSVLGLKPGDAIALTAGDFAKLSKAFFAELEKRYT